MKIEEALNALWKKSRELQGQNGPEYVPQLAVYMDYDFYVECQREIHGPVSNGVYEFSRQDTLSGYPVWTVTPRHTDGGQHVRHPPFTIVDLEQ
jgi:hypothetical protein